MTIKGKPETRIDLSFWLLLALILILAAILFVRTTPAGVGMVSDSVNYINGARFIAQGKGYFRESGGGTLKPITNFPPLYSILLSIPILLGVNEIDAAWWFSLVFYVLNLFLVAVLIRRITGNRWLGLAAAVLFLSSKPFLYYQVFAMSEPLFFFCTLVAFLLLVIGFENDNGWVWFGCGLACGAAFLTRYVGAVSLGAVIGAILLIAPRNGRKIQSLLRVFAGALPLMAAWLIRNYLVSGNISNREAYQHPLTAADFRTGVLIFWKWLYPERYAGLENPVRWMQLAVLAAGLLGAAYLIFLTVRGFRTRANFSLELRMIWVFVLYIFGYLLLVYLTISFLDASVNIEERILFPCLLALLLAFLTGIGWLIRRKLKILAAANLLIALFLIFTFSQDLLHFAPRFGEEGYGWAWQGWADSPAMKLIMELPSETVLYSNQPEAVSLIAGRGAYALLDPIDPSSHLERPGYQETMQNIRGQVLSGESVLVFFGINAWIEEGKENWITQLCDGLPFIYQDTSEWVLGKLSEEIQ